jgi:hypothetical protein
MVTSKSWENQEVDLLFVSILWPDPEQDSPPLASVIEISSAQIPNFPGRSISQRVDWGWEHSEQEEFNES